MFNKFTTAGISHPAQGSAEFDGASDYIDLEDNFQNIIATGKSGSVCAWIYTNTTTPRQVWFDHYLDSSNRLVIWFDETNNSLNFYPNKLTTSFGISANRWYFVSATWDGANSSWYVDGSLVSTQSYTPFNTDSTILGTNYALSQFLDGNLANVAIWNRALSSDEINSVMWKSYDGLTPSETSGLQAWYSLDDITSPAASLANMEQLAADKDATIENKAAITAAINALS